MHETAYFIQSWQKNAVCFRISRVTECTRILSYIRKGSIRQVYSLREGEGEVIEADAVEASSVVNKKISELKLPNGVKIGAVLKNENDVHIPNPNLQINEGDRVILFSLSKMIKKVENLLSVRFRFY